MSRISYNKKVDIVSKVPRVMIAGTNSGCGKTTIVCALLQALCDRGLRTGAFKCGPDYIDPMFHSRIIGAKSYNLDSFFFPENTLRYLLTRNGEDCEISIIEGVMGFYDGIGFDPDKASSYEIARITHSPVILTVNARGAAASVMAVIHGFLTFMPDNQICGVILNQCSDMTYPRLAAAITKQFEGKVKPLGYLPVIKNAVLESRHLGLVTAAEVRDLKEKMHLLAQQAEKTLDIEGVLALAEQAGMVSCHEVPVCHFEEKIRIAVAKDNAFCFYYEDSLDMLRRMGAELLPFSPLEDPALPENIDALYLGGGYPELYTNELGRNKSMLESIREAIRCQLPCIAECGGYMYLTEQIGEEPMSGAIPGKCFNTGRLSRFGYVELKANRDNMLCKEGESIRAHEFHYWDSEDNGDAFTAEKQNGRQWTCVHASGSLYAGFPHFHFYANPGFAEGFYRTCLERKQRNTL